MTDATPFSPRDVVLLRDRFVVTVADFVRTAPATVTGTVAQLIEADGILGIRAVNSRGIVEAAEAELAYRLADLYCYAVTRDAGRGWQVIGWAMAEQCGCGHPIAAHARRVGECGASQRALGREAVHCVCGRYRAAKMATLDPGAAERRAFQDGLRAGRQQGGGYVASSKRAVVAARATEGRGVR